MTAWSAPAHPHLIATPELIAQAKTKLTAGFAPAVKALACAQAAARQAAVMELPVFDHAWFKGKTFDDWAEIYPQVTRDCTFIPRPYAEAALGAALDYVITDCAESLRATVRVLNHFAAHYQFDIEHYDVGMDYAGWGLQLLYAYDLIYREVLPQEREALDRFFSSWEAAIYACDQAWIKHGWGGYYNNHYAWHVQAIAAYGLFYNRPELVDYAFSSPMGIRECLVHSLVDDGLWFESSTHYNFVAGYAYVVLAWCLRNSGWPEDLFAARYGQAKGLRPLYDAALALLTPDGMLPNVGDCYGSRAELPAFQYEFAYAIYGDPRYAWVLAHHERDEDGLGMFSGLFAAQELGPQLEPSVNTRIWPEHGYALLTQSGAAGYFGECSASCFVNFGYSGVHNNADRTSIELYAAGQRWLVDAESAASGHSFSAQVQRELNRSTLCHNLVSVDAHDQHSIAHTLKMHSFKPDIARIVIGDEGELYAGVTQVRSIALLQEELQDRIELSSAERHQYDYQLHLNAGIELELELPWQPASRLGQGVEYNWVRGAVQAAIPGHTLIFTLRQNGRMMNVALEVPQNALVIKGYLPRTHDYQPPHRQFIIIRAADRLSATFQARFCWQYPA
ncbi:MAG: heparinase II/III family protein [Chloroflexi bacterium]|nr:heparinase II/III family protein [Chloroflexota bacterium]